jgi:hypothetical protein
MQPTIRHDFDRAGLTINAYPAVKKISLSFTLASAQRGASVGHLF